MNLTKGEALFITKLLNKKPELRHGTQLIFITNKSECGPCEEQVQAFYSEDFENHPKTFVVSPNQQYGNQWKDTLQFTYRELGSYGLIRVTGAVLILDHGECTLLESIDLAHLNHLKDQILKELQN
ncbi:hypothetical protein [Fluviicola sp.]|uniref:hypothetical protein n=1 Tax=Fluviicola sp. TaxID=1917219 RepID=UPI00282BB231|nr:hypothetical protein [Fluviicola sp.]MDR0802435.1 hypothetical protein [Fluviicola sp.]